MDPVTLIVAALAVGAAKGVGDAAASAVGDLYQQLKVLVTRGLGGTEQAQAVLAAHEADPPGARGSLAELLTDHDLAEDTAVVELALRLLKLADPAGATAGKYSVTAVGSQGLQVGDHNIQRNTFGT